MTVGQLNHCYLSADAALACTNLASYPYRPLECQAALYGCPTGGTPVPVPSTGASRASGTVLVTDSLNEVAYSDLFMINAAQGSVTYTITGAQASSFSITDGPGSPNLSNTSCRRMQLSFTAPCAGTYTATLTVTYTPSLAGSGSISVVLRGVARAPLIGLTNQATGSIISSGAAPSTASGTNMGFVAPSSTTTLTIRVTNAGPRPLTLRAPVLTQPASNAGSFTITAGVPSPLDVIIVASNGATSFTVQFAAPASNCGVYNATLTIACDICTKQVVVNLQATVQQSTLPTIAGCVASLPSINNQPGLCYGAVSFASLSSTYCGAPLALVGPSPAIPSNLAPVGTTNYVFTAVSPIGNVSCTTAVTVIDNEKPVITCPPSITISSCYPNYRYLPPVATDNCAASVSQTAGLPSGALFSGTTTNTFVATDASNNQAMCSFTVTVTVSQCATPGANGAGPAGSDKDGDGFTVAQGDCCDTTDQCRNPFLVNPGASEVPGNGVDDNCDGRVDENRDCDLAIGVQRISQWTIEALELFPRALGLCERVDDDSDRRSGYTFYQPYHPRISLADGYYGKQPNPLQAELVKSFGAITAISNVGILLSTGAARQLGEPGRTSSDQNMQTSSTPPQAWPTSTHPPYPPSCGPMFVSNPVYDSIRYRLWLRMPLNYRGFAFRFLFGAEQPDGFYPPHNLCSPQKDFFMILTNAKSAPPGGNIAVDSSGEYISTLNPGADFWTRCRQYSNNGACQEGPYSLTSTGYDGSSGWLTAGANADPGSLIYIDFLLFDAGDYKRDSFVFIDQMYYIAEEATSPAYGPRTLSDLTMTSVKTVASLKTSTLAPSVTIQFTFRNNGPEPTHDIFVSFTPPRGTSFISAAIGQTILTCTVQGGAYTKCAVPQSLNARGVCSLDFSSLISD